MAEIAKAFGMQSLFAAHQDRDGLGPLVRSLDDALISGIRFDVLSGEPPAADNPLMRIAGRPNVIVTPHVAWASDEAQQSLADQLMGNIERFVRGEPANLAV
ncbi:phosphoglycerate dehydrogenase-like enzyme [Paraburkholderia youngii]|uniref:NAD(P)-dependent oxidoreductase n=1 Tax=Paraburkholderia youngii TaxID=2782701 RepID=UPI003D1E9973